MRDVPSPAQHKGRQCLLCTRHYYYAHGSCTLSTTLWSQSHWYSHFADEKTETEQECTTCPRLKEWKCQGLHSKLFDLRDCDLNHSTYCLFILPADKKSKLREWSFKNILQMSITRELVFPDNFLINSQYLLSKLTFKEKESWQSSNEWIFYPNQSLYFLNPKSTHNLTNMIKLWIIG